MISSNGKQIITKRILSNISRRISNQSMKFGQLLEYNMRNTFLKYHAENKAGRLVPDLFAFQINFVLGKSKKSAP